MISPAGVTIRDARPGDLAAIAGVFIACWRTSYAGWLPDQLTEMYDQEGAETLWRRVLEEPRAGSSTFVAVDADRAILGVVRAGRDPDEPSVGHIYSLYVDPAVQGRGVGSRLLLVANEWLRAEGLEEATLWVFAANGSALRFYARLGWEADGGERIEPEYGQPEVRLRRSRPGG